MTKSEIELFNVLKRYDEILKDKVKNEITHVYVNAMMEVDRRRLTEKANSDRPRIQYFLKTMFFYIFSKLHKGDKIKAYELVEEMKEEMINI